MGLVTMKYEMLKAIKGGYAVPAFNFNNLEQLQAIRMNGKSAGLIARKALVGNLDGFPITHGVYNNREPFLAGRNLFEENLAPHIPGFVQEIVHG